MHMLKIIGTCDRSRNVELRNVHEFVKKLLPSILSTKAALKFFENILKTATESQNLTLQQGPTSWTLSRGEAVFMAFPLI